MKKPNAILSCDLPDDMPPNKEPLNTLYTYHFSGGGLGTGDGGLKILNKESAKKVNDFIREIVKDKDNFKEGWE